MLVLLFLVLIVRGINQNDWFLMVISGIFFLNFMTESMLERADGTIFIPMILGLALYRKD